MTVPADKLKVQEQTLTGNESSHSQHNSNTNAKSGKKKCRSFRSEPKIMSPDGTNDDSSQERLIASQEEEPKIVVDSNVNEQAEIRICAGIKIKKLTTMLTATSQIDQNYI